MNLPKLSKSKTLPIRLVMMFFKISGFAPFKVTVLEKLFSRKRLKIHLSYSLGGAAYNFILSLPIIRLMVLTIANYSVENPTYILSKCMIISSAFVAPVILGYYCLKQKAIIKLFNKLLKLEDNLFDTFNRSVSRRNGLVTYEAVVLIVYISLTISHVALNHIIANQHPWKTFLLILFLEIILNNLILQYSLIVYYIYKRLNYMNDLLLSLSRSDNNRFRSEVSFLTSSSHNQMILKTIVLIRELQRRFYGVFKEISKFFTWPILLTMAIFCVRILLFTFKFVKQLILRPEKTEFLVFIECPVSVLKEMFLVIIMARHITQITFEMQKTGEIVYKIMDTHCASGGIQSELEQFSIEILLRRTPKSIFRLFKIDGSLVAKIVRSTITYVIILIQFKYNLNAHDENDGSRNLNIEHLAL